jgi:cytochrome c-type biogenesis protein CcmH
VIVFLATCALLVVLALAFILPPLRHPDRAAPASSESEAEANLAVYRRQLSELESELRDRMVTTEQFLQGREELEARLIDDLPKESRQARDGSGPGSSTLMYLLACGLPVVAVLLYLALGAPASL